MVFFDAFARFADFSGRSSRSEFWPFFLIHYLVVTILVILIFTVGWGFVIPLVLYGLVSIIPIVALQVRRLHDTGRSGWWFAFAQCVPCLGCIVFVFYLQGSDGPNQYGA
jgi:uncharacterized membrane protein YhaH (DUF805 family)